MSNKGLAHSKPEGGLSIPTEIVARLEVAEAGSNALDIEVLCLIDGFALERRDQDKAAHLYHADGRRRESHFGGAGSAAEAYRVTRSLDAALALAERVLPGARWIIVQQDGGWGVMPLLFDGASWDCPNDPGETVHPALPVALCIAILKATTASSVGTSASECTQKDNGNEG